MALALRWIWHLDCGGVGLGGWRREEREVAGEGDGRGLRKKYEENFCTLRRLGFWAKEKEG